MHINEIIGAIYGLETEEELDRVYYAYKERAGHVRQIESLKVSASLQEGDRITFYAKKLGGQVSGVITKKKKTRADVKLDEGSVLFGQSLHWTVPFSMLKKEEKKEKESEVDCPSHPENPPYTKDE